MADEKKKEPSPKERPWVPTTFGNMELGTERPPPREPNVDMVAKVFGKPGDDAEKRYENAIDGAIESVVRRTLMSPEQLEREARAAKLEAAGYTEVDGELVKLEAVKKKVQATPEQAKSLEHIGFVEIPEDDAQFDEHGEYIFDDDEYEQEA